ncbi:hypothetical protein LCM00_18570 [Bacillus infantis]|uniref:hypothetical protein n=1 Tax=Bacillus infantis TaxID=324767 RepID=UPI001CD77F4A|nr:hypothetical protein [Bacillus infantis]MCA1041525.1 hypothetical protein [Bacillus infantis]
MFEWIIVYSLFCLSFWFYLQWKKEENRFVKTIIVTFIPIFGFVLSYLLFKTPSRLQKEEESQEENEELSSLLPSGGKIKMEREINFIPFQDALLSSDNQLKRSMLIDSLKNGDNNIGILTKAIKSEDSETSHYAATAIMEIQKKYIASLQSSIKRLGESPSDYEAMDDYAKTLTKYIESGLLDKETALHYRERLSSLLEDLLNSPLKCRQYYVEKIHCDLELGRSDKTEYYSQLFLESYPYDEQAYITALKVYYAAGNLNKLNDVLDTLRRTPIQLSPKGFRALHFWS